MYKQIMKYVATYIWFFGLPYFLYSYLPLAQEKVEIIQSALHDIRERAH